jgi:hypothetical protein
MNNLTGLDALNRADERLEKRTIVLHPIPWNVDDDNSKSQLLEIVLMLETFVDSDQNVTLTLSLGNQLGVWKRTPSGFRDGHDFMIWESLPETRVDALV